jgi:hypothetical protein
MGVSLKAISLSSAILWGTAMLLVGLTHMGVPSYGGEFLRIISSVYPGADTAPTLGRVLLGTVYGLADGVVAGLLFGWLYRAFAGYESSLEIGSNRTTPRGNRLYSCVKSIILQLEMRQSAFQADPTVTPNMEFTQ